MGVALSSEKKDNGHLALRTAHDIGRHTPVDSIDKTLSVGSFRRVEKLRRKKQAVTTCSEHIEFSATPIVMPFLGSKSCRGGLGMASLVCRTCRRFPAQPTEVVEHATNPVKTRTLEQLLAWLSGNAISNQRRRSCLSKKR